MNLNRILSYSKHAMLLLAMLTIVGISGCDDDDGDSAPTKNLWETIDADSNLSMFADQLEAADFDATLSASGTTSFTVFAPSNAAMNNLLLTLFPTQTPPDPEMFEQIAPTVIQAVLNYHIVEGERLAASLTNNAELTTEQGENIKVVVTNTGEKTLDTGASSDALISRSDIKATNGVIHVVETVLVPPTIGNLIIATLGKVAQPVLLSSTFSIMAGGILTADAGKAPANTIVGLLSQAPAVTVFAIPNQALQAVPGINNFTADQWDALIRGHIVAENLTTLSSGTKTTINGKTITITTGGAATTVAGAGNPNPVPIAAAAIPASNGTVYPIGGVLLHP